MLIEHQFRKQWNSKLSVWQNGYFFKIDYTRTPKHNDHEELECRYWEDIKQKAERTVPIYATNVDGSLFDKDCNEWNLKDSFDSKSFLFFIINFIFVVEANIIELQKCKIKQLQHNSLNFWLIEKLKAKLIRCCWLLSEINMEKQL